MAAQFSRSILKVSVAQICQNIGWHAVHQSTLELLADILHRYVLEIARTAQAYSNQGKYPYKFISYMFISKE